MSSVNQEKLAAKNLKSENSSKIIIMHQCRSDEGVMIELLRNRIYFFNLNPEAPLIFPSHWMLDLHNKPSKIFGIWQQVYKTASVIHRLCDKKYLGIKNLASNRQDIGIACKAGNNGSGGKGSGFHVDLLKKDGDLRQNPTMLRRHYRGEDSHQGPFKASGRNLFDPIWPEMQP